MKPSTHTLTNADVIRQFLDVSIGIEHEGGEAYGVAVNSNNKGITS